jgi:hypothetical protein
MFNGLKSKIFAVIFLLTFIGCGSVATKHKFYDPIADDLKTEKFSDAVVKVEAARANNNYAKKDRLLYYLDAGLSNHYANNYIPSNEKLSEAERAAEDLFTKSVSRGAASFLLNDNVLEYSGEDYEVLYANLIMALNYLSLDKFDEAFVEIRRANEKLQLLEQKYAGAADLYSQKTDDDTTDVNSKIDYDIEKVKFNNDAFARYLSMHMYAADGNYDDARIDYDMLKSAFKTQPHIYDFSLPNVSYKPQSKDNAIISCVALTGLSPEKRALALRIRTDKQLQLVQVLYTSEAKKDVEYGHIMFPVKSDYYFKFSLPEIVPRYSDINRIKIKANNEIVGELKLIEDISKVAIETFKAKQSLVYFRSIARAIVKGLAAQKLKANLDQKTGGGLGGWLAKAAVDVGTDAIENADLRCARLLPGKIYVGDFEIAPGNYNITVDFYNANGSLVLSKLVSGFQVNKGDFNIIEIVALR